MDEIDYRILEILQCNGRIPMKKLAEQINMSTPATIERVKKLEGRQAIQGYKAVVRPDRVGREVSAFLMISLSEEKRCRFYQYVNESNCVIDVYELAGRFSEMVYISCRDMEEFLNTMHDLYAIGTTETYLITDRIKTGIYQLNSDPNSTECRDRKEQKPAELFSISERRNYSTRKKEFAF